MIIVYCHNDTYIAKFHFGLNIHKLNIIITSGDEVRKLMVPHVCCQKYINKELVQGAVVQVCNFCKCLMSTLFVKSLIIRIKRS